MTQSNRMWFAGSQKSLCELSLQAGQADVSALFTTSEPLECFFVAASPEKKGERLSIAIAITGDGDFLSRFSNITDSMRFSFVPAAIPPGTYQAVLKQEAGKRIRSKRPMADLYFSAIICMCVFPFVAVLGCLTGLISDGDWRGFIENVPGPLWLVKALVIGVLLVNGFILRYVSPELWRAWKLQKDNIEAKLRPFSQG